MHEPDAAARQLMADNEALRARLEHLLEQARSNHEILRRHQAFDLEIVAAASFQALAASIFRQLPVLCDLDIVTLALVDPGADIHTVLHRLDVDFDALPKLMFVDDPAELGFDAAPGTQPRPRLLPYAPDAQRAQFPHPPPGLRSVALAPLVRNGRLIGSLNLGSTDPSRFTPALGTDFIEHMASIIAICLENVISNEMLKYIGLTDAVTGVCNRRYIDRRLVEEIARARRQDYRISCMVIDIDHFKQVNYSVGQPGGDAVLREVAARIRAELRMSDVLARFGGAEFMVLLIDAGLASAAAVAERIRAGVAGQAIELGGGLRAAVSVSIGVATLVDFEREHAVEGVARQLVEQADEALYRAKENGRNRVVVDPVA